MKYSKAFKLNLFIVIIFFSINAYSQIGSKDKKIAYSIALMKKQLKSMKDKHRFSDDSVRIEVLNRIAALYIERSKDSALYYANEALIRANKLKQKDLIAVSYHNIGETYSFYNDTINAENNFLGWYKIRKAQGGDKFRWALKGMREFYSKYGQIDKLEKIEEEWIVVLDKQYDEKHKSLWMPEDYDSPAENYRLSMYPIFLNLIELKEYFIAEKLFIHMAQKCPDCCNWLDSDMPYFKVENILLSQSDTVTLSVWYNHWFSTLDNYCQNKNVAFNVFKTISDKYLSSYYDYSEKYYQKMLSYTNQMGGDSATYQMLEHSINSYSKSTYQDFKFNMFSLKICIKTNDSINMEKHYQSLDWIVSGHSSFDTDTKYKILNLLVATEKSAKDERLKNWCKDAIKKI